MSQRFGGKLGRNGFKLKKLQKIDFARSFALSYLETCMALSSRIFIPGPCLQSDTNHLDLPPPPSLAHARPP